MAGLVPFLGTKKLGNDDNAPGVGNPNDVCSNLSEPTFPPPRGYVAGEGMVNE
jgi:hypothetical protein